MIVGATPLSKFKLDMILKAWFKISIITSNIMTMIL